MWRRLLCHSLVHFVCQSTVDGGLSTINPNV